MDSVPTPPLCPSWQGGCHDRCALVISFLLPGCEPYPILDLLGTFYRGLGFTSLQPGDTEEEGEIATDPGLKDLGLSASALLPGCLILGTCLCCSVPPSVS